MNENLRASVLERDGWQCQDCGIDVGESVGDKPTAEVHHKTPRSQGGTDSSENLTTLCPNCHSKRPGKEANNGGGRPLNPPKPKEVLARMGTEHCYVVADLVVEFEDGYDPSRGTVRNRLESLADGERVRRREHANGMVSYRRLG